MKRKNVRQFDVPHLYLMMLLNERNVISFVFNLIEIEYCCYHSYYGIRTHLRLKLATDGMCRFLVPHLFWARYLLVTRSYKPRVCIWLQMKLECCNETY